MDKRINIAVILTASENMAAVVSKSVSASLKQLDKFNAVAGKMQNFGAKSIAVGAAAAAPLVLMAKEFGDQENSMLQMRAEMMQDGGKINEVMFKQLTDFAKKSTEVYGGTAEEYMKMTRVLRENSVDPKEILGGIGGSVEQLAVAFEMMPDKIGQFAARMRQDMGIKPTEMMGMMDLIARLKNAGVGKDGEEAVTEMGDAFSKAGLGAHNLGINGLQASKDLGALMGIFIRRGISGSTVGNNFRRIFDGLRDADKLKKTNDIAKQFGLTLDFYDKNHQFKGIANFTGELNKLKGLSTTQISAILKPFGGKQGLSTDFLEFLGKEGTSSFNEFQHKLASQGTLAQKVKVVMSGLNRQFDRTHSMAVNTGAAIGESYAPELKKLLNTINNSLTSLSNFVKGHRTLTKVAASALGIFSGLAISVGSVSLAIGSGIKIFSYMQVAGGGLGKVIIWIGQGLLYAGAYVGRLGMLLLMRGIPAMATFTATVWANAAAWLANPATWIILAIIAAVAALVAIGIIVYKNWDKIMSWFSDKWIIMKAGVAGTIAVFKLFGDVLIGVGKAMLGLWTFNPKMMIEGAKQAAAAVSKIANGGISAAFNKGADGSLKASGARINANGDVIRNASPAIRPNSSITKSQNITHVTQHYAIAVHGAPADDHGAFARKIAQALKDQQAREARLNNR